MGPWREEEVGRFARRRAGTADAEELAADPRFGGHRRRHGFVRLIAGQAAGAAAGDLREPAERAGLRRRGNLDAHLAGRFQRHDDPAENARVAGRRAGKIAPGKTVLGARASEEADGAFARAVASVRRRSTRKPRTARWWPSHGNTCRRLCSCRAGRRRVSVARAGNRALCRRFRRICRRFGCSPRRGRRAGRGRSGRCRLPSRRIRRSTLRRAGNGRCSRRRRARRCRRRSGRSRRPIGRRSLDGGRASRGRVRRPVRSRGLPRSETRGPSGWDRGGNGRLRERRRADGRRLLESRKARDAARASRAGGSTRRSRSESRMANGADDADGRERRRMSPSGASGNAASRLGVFDDLGRRDVGFGRCDRRPGGWAAAAAGGRASRTRGASTGGDTARGRGSDSMGASRRAWAAPACRRIPHRGASAFADRPRRLRGAAFRPRGDDVDRHGVVRGGFGGEGRRLNCRGGWRFRLVAWRQRDFFFLGLRERRGKGRQACRGDGAAARTGRVPGAAERGRRGHRRRWLVPRDDRRRDVVLTPARDRNRGRSRRFGRGVERFEPVFHGGRRGIHGGRFGGVDRQFVTFAGTNRDLGKRGRFGRREWAVGQRPGHRRGDPKEPRSRRRRRRRPSAARGSPRRWSRSVPP